MAVCGPSTSQASVGVAQQKGASLVTGAMHPPPSGAHIKERDSTHLPHCFNLYTELSFFEFSKKNQYTKFSKK